MIVVVPQGLPGSGLYSRTGTLGFLRWSPTRIQGSLTSTLHCRVRQGSDIRCIYVGSGSPVMGRLDSGTAMGLNFWIRPALFLSWTSSI